MDLPTCFIIGLDGCISAMFLFVEGFVFTSAIDVESIPLVEDVLLLYVQNVRPVWVNLINIAPPDPFTPLSDAFLPLVLTSSTPLGMWSPRLVASTAKLLAIKLLVTMLAWFRS